jgi:hypothetical protein
MAPDDPQGDASTAPPGAEAEAIEATANPAAASPAIPQDTDDTRGLHFRALLRSPWTIGLTVVFAIAAAVGGIVGAGPAVGAIAAVAVFFLAVLIVFIVASGRAKEDFFDAYASGRGLNRQGKGSLPPTTPLLRKGDRRYGEQIMNGTLPSGLPGAIALYTYEERHRDSEGHEDVDYYRFTVVLHDIPAVAHNVSQVMCQRRSGFRWMDSAEDVFRRMKRLELESTDLDKRYEIFFGPDDDEVWLKRLFSPKFIVWLSETVPDGIAFECVGGSLCVNRRGHYDNAADLDVMCNAAGDIARRLAGESEQTNLPR